MSTPQAESTPSHAEYRAGLTRAAELHRPLARAAKVGIGNGTGYAIFGGLSLGFALVEGVDLVGLMIGAVLLAIGFYERAQSARLLHADMAAPLRLAWGELALFGAIALYGAYGLTAPPVSSELLQQLGGAQELGVDVQTIVAGVTTMWYTSLIVVSLVYQGGMALYFRRRGADVARYREEVPAWAREVVESMAK